MITLGNFEYSTINFDHKNFVVIFLYLFQVCASTAIRHYPLKRTNRNTTATSTNATIAEIDKGVIRNPETHCKTLSGYLPFFFHSHLYHFVYQT